MKNRNICRAYTRSEQKKGPLLYNSGGQQQQHKNATHFIVVDQPITTCQITAHSTMCNSLIPLSALPPHHSEQQNKTNLAAIPLLLLIMTIHVDTSVAPIPAAPAPRPALFLPRSAPFLLSAATTTAVTACRPRLRVGTLAVLLGSGRAAPRAALGPATAGAAAAAAAAAARRRRAAGRPAPV